MTYNSSKTGAQVDGAVDDVQAAKAASPTDTTAGRLLKVGDFGAGAAAGTTLLGTGNTPIQPNATQFIVGEGANESLRVDSSGNLLVGTTSPVAGVKALFSESFGHSGKSYEVFKRFGAWNQNAKLIIPFSWSVTNNTSNAFLELTIGVGLAASAASAGGIGRYRIDLRRLNTSLLVSTITAVQERTINSSWVEVVATSGANGQIEITNKGLWNFSFNDYRVNVCATGEGNLLIGNHSIV